MITVLLNGAKETLPNSMQLSDALHNWKHAGSDYAVAVNESFVPKSHYAQTQLKDGDRVELVAPMQGG